LEGLAVEVGGIFMAILFIFLPNVIFYGHLVHFVVNWYIFPVSVCCTEKNLATLVGGIVTAAICHILSNLCY
jgi:uncharacterized metal-binding protein